MAKYVRTVYILYNKYIFIKCKHIAQKLIKMWLKYEYRHRNTVTKSE